MKTALISLNQIWEDKAANLARSEELAKLAVYGGAEIVIFPEMTLTGFTMNTGFSAEDPYNSPSCAAFKALARRYNVSIVAGVVLQKGNKSANTLIVFSQEGTELARYTKLHPFTPAGEDRWFAVGDALAFTKVSEFTVGLTICYDLRFPEVYSALAKTCDLVINIANWPQPRVNHWRTLLQARAIENQFFVIGVNRTGIDGNGINYERSSGIANPNGDFLNASATKDEIDWFDVSREELLGFRRGFSTRQDRRPDFYREVI